MKLTNNQKEFIELRILAHRDLQEGRRKDAEIGLAVANQCWKLMTPKQREVAANRLSKESRRKV